MKLRELEIENFGLFMQYQVVFPTEGLQVVLGANEAGKSTLLQLIRELLFGFPVRNPYAFPEHTGEMAATAYGELADGTRVRYRRRKGRRDVVVGQYEPDGPAVDEAELQRLLGGAGPELFTNVFGFSLAELATAEESLKRANLSEALFGGALGGLAGFRQVLDSIRRAHGQLFAATASKRPVNALLTEIRQQARDLNVDQVRPRDFRQLRDEAETLDAQVARLRAEREELQRSKAARMRLAESLELWRQRAPLLDELGTLHTPEDFPADGARQYEQLRAQRDAMQGEAEDFATELAGVREQLGRLRPRADVVARGAEIRRLEQQLEQIRGFRRDLVLRRQESQSVKDLVLARLRQLDPGWTLAHLDRFRATLAQRSQIELLRDAGEEFDRRLTELSTLQPALETDIAVLRARLAELQDQRVPDGLGDLVDGAHEYVAKVDRLAQWQDQFQELSVRGEAVATRLATLGGSADNLAECPVPLAATVEDFRAQWSQCQQQVTLAAEELKRTDASLRKCRRQRSVLRAAQNVPDRNQLATSRAHREAGWQLIRTAFLDGQAVDPAEISAWVGEPARELAEAYETAVRDADHVADLRLEHAETVARQDQLAAQIEDLEGERQRQKESLQAAQGGQQACTEQWETLWQPCGFVPAPPEAMAEWLKYHQELVAITINRDTVARRIADLGAEVERFEAELCRLLETAEGLPRARLAEARRRVQHARDVRAQRQTCETDLANKNQQLVSLRNQLETLNRERQDWTKRWRASMQEYGFPESWTVHTAMQVLSGLSEARLEYEQAESLDRRVADMKSGLDLFERDTAALCGQLAPELAGVMAEHAVEELSGVLQKARADQADLTRLTDQQARLEQRIAAKRTQQARVDQTLATLLQQAGAADEAALLQVAVQVARKQQLQTAVDALDNQLLALRGSQDARAFTAELEASDAATLDSELRVLDSRLQDVDAQFDHALRQQALAHDRLRRLDESGQAADLQMRLESNRARLRAAVDQWVPLVLAESLMRTAMEQFEREHQPALLADVARLLRQMTCGRYVAVTRKLDEQGTLVVEAADGAIREPAQLSTGTREQLYLAIRLAYIRHYCRDAEPLPVIMDDVLVNFDDTRALQTLEALAEFAEQVQVLLLTCHQSTVDKAAQVVPGLQPILLGG